jgi:60 kDa SS-A/Ro ribonucleoprotein
LTKFNKKSTITQKLKARPDATVNKAGGLAFEMDAKTKLVNMVASCFIEPEFYTPNVNAVVKGLQEAIAAVLKIDPVFVLKLAAYARNEMYLRSVPLFLVNEFANSGIEVFNSRRYVPAVVRRADELTELLALSMASRPRAKHKPSQFIKFGLARALNNFDAYQLSKYNRDGEVKLKDVISLCHPIPKSEEQQDIFDAIMNNNLPSADTWEVATSAKGSSKETWEEILPKMGYMAVLKNLNNFIRNGVNPEIVYGKLVSPEAIAKSKQYPFRFLTAYIAIKNAAYMGQERQNSLITMAGLNKALDISISNIPKIPGRSLVLIDASASMEWNHVSGSSIMTTGNIANLFGAISDKICDYSDVIVFADTFGKVELLPYKPALENAMTIERADVGGATLAYLPIQFITQNHIEYDRIFLFSDGQCYGNSSLAAAFTAYQRQVTPAYLYSFDLQSYGYSQFPQDMKNVMLLGGFSEKLFNFIPKYETDDKETLVRTIEGYKI